MADSCPYLPFTKWYCSSGRHSVKALNYWNSGKRELLLRRWNSYNMISSCMFVFDGSSPNNHLLIPFHSTLVSSAPPWSIALFSNNVIPLDLVPVNRPLSISKVTKLIQRRMPCKQLYFAIEQISCLTRILDSDNDQFSGNFWLTLESMWGLDGYQLRTSHAIPSTTDEFNHLWCSLLSHTHIARLSTVTTISQEKQIVMN